MENKNALAKRVWVLVGTRPEVIKQVPVYWALQKALGADRVALIGTGQHRELLDQSLAHFGASLDFNLQVMQPGASLSALAGRLMTEFGKLVAEARPSLVVVQGDTLSAAMAGFSCFLERIPVVHNEAGLRSHDLEQPFPEEANRRIVSVFADLHLAPTRLAAQALRSEGVPEERIHIVGNPVVDALIWTLERPSQSTRLETWLKRSRAGRKLVLITSHRRENAQAMDAWYQTLARFMAQHPDVDLICPIHPNNLARSAAERLLEYGDRTVLVEPLDYHETCHLIRHCHMVVTDSGGIQEECATLGIPVVICRKKTERMEAVEVGIGQLADPESDEAVRSSLAWAYEHGPSRESQWPYGRGDSGKQIAELVRGFLDQRGGAL